MRVWHRMAKCSICNFRKAVCMCRTCNRLGLANQLCKDCALGKHDKSRTHPLYPKWYGGKDLLAATGELVTQVERTKILKSAPSVKQFNRLTEGGKMKALAKIFRPRDPVTGKYTRMLVA